MRSEADVAGTILILATTRPSGGYGSPIRAAPRIDPFVFSPLALAILGLELIPWKKQGRSGLRTLLIALSIIRLGAVAIWGFMEGRRELAREADFSPAQASKLSYTQPWLIKLKALFSIAVLLTGFGTAVAQSDPQPPCGGAQPVPEYSKPGVTPNYHVWRESDPGDRWTPPTCLGWTPKEGTLVAIAGQFHYRGNVDGLLSRFGAVSTLAGLQYWSIRESGWRTLITNVAALDGPDTNRPRGDFSLDEMKSGTDLYFTETDNRTAQPIIYRMRVEATPSNLTISIENVTPMRQFLFTLLGPGDLQSEHFFARAGPNTWAYYGLARTGVSTSLLEVNEESYVNRALALYSHFTGTPVAPVRQPERGR